MTNEPENLIAQYEADTSLFHPDQLLKRIEALDALDGYIGIIGAESVPAARARAIRLRAKLESANAAIYDSIRNQIQQHEPLSHLLHWIERCSNNDERPTGGLGYGNLDELISGVLQSREPETVPLHPQPEMVFYQPTPARHILQLIRLSALSESDTLIDLGSGLGHVTVLASILTGAQCIGIEAESAYVASARECAASLQLNRVDFIQQNASEADLSPGTVFYLYTPFTGNTLSTVLQNLRNLSEERPITICTLGPCTLTISAESWLTPTTNPGPDEITIFRSRL